MCLPGSKGRTSYHKYEIQLKLTAFSDKNLVTSVACLEEFALVCV